MKNVLFGEDRKQFRYPPCLRRKAYLNYMWRLIISYKISFNRLSLKRNLRYVSKLNVFLGKLVDPELREVFNVVNMNLPMLNRV